MISILNDYDVMEVFKNADTDGIPNFCSPKSKLLLQKLKPKNLLDLCAIYSLDRGLNLEIALNEYIVNNQNENEIIYIHPMLKKYLYPTYGVILYFEQIEFILQEIANFTISESVTARKELGKRSFNEFEKYYLIFQNKCLCNKEFLEHCEEIGRDPIYFVKKIWNLFEKKIVETISFAFVLNEVSNSYLQAKDICDKKIN